MRIQRHLSAALATVLVVGAVSLVGTTAPASAVTATKIVSGTAGKGWIYDSSYRTQPGAPVYGDTLSLSIEVETATGEQVYDGTITVQRQLPGQAWKTIKTSTSAYLYDSVKAVGNANYRAVYSGSGDYAPSGAGVKAKVQRRITDQVESGRGAAKYHGKISPRVGKALVQIKKGKHAPWKKFKNLRVSKRGVWSVKVTGPRTGAWYYRVVIAAGHGFAASQSVATGIHRI